MNRPAVFLDRDGTLIDEVNYLSKVDDLRVFPFAGEALQALRVEGYLTVVVTNQSGIGRGRFVEDAMHQIHSEILRLYPEMIDAFYFCPHVPEDKCECRKPGIGMFTKAVDDLGICMERSWMVGDKLLDIEAGRNARIRTILVKTGYGGHYNNECGIEPDYVADNLLVAARYIANNGVTT